MSEGDVEEEHVHKVYSEIAAHFSDTRFKPWPKIAKFLEDQPTGSLIADVGCGNGKYLGVNPNVAILGSDICPELVSIGRSRGHEVLVCDCLHLPYRSNLFDSIICIAVIHHLSTQARRQAAVKEMARVLRSGGSMLLYVWAMEQERKKFEKQDVMVPWHLQPKYRGDTGGNSAEETKPKARKPKKGRRKQRRKEQAAEESEMANKELVAEVGGSKELKIHGEDEPDKLLECLSLCEDVCSAGVHGPLHESGGCCPDEELLENRCVAASTEEKRHYSRERQRLVQATEQELSETEFTVQLSNLQQGVGEKMVQYSAKSVDGETKEETSLKDLGYSTYQRYYHVFKEGELLELVREVPGLELKLEYYDHENWCLVAVKIVDK